RNRNDDAQGAAPTKSKPRNCNDARRRPAVRNRRWPLIEPADPDAFGGGFAEMDARRALTGDRESHRLIIFALMDPQARAWPEAEVHKKFEKVRVLFVYAHHLVRMADLGFRKTHGAVFTAKLLHASEEWNAVRAAAVAAETFEQKADNFRRDSVLEAFGFFVRARPFEA